MKNQKINNGFLFTGLDGVVYLCEKHKGVRSFFYLNNKDWQYLGEISKVQFKYAKSKKIKNIKGYLPEHEFTTKRCKPFLTVCNVYSADIPMTSLIF